MKTICFFNNKGGVGKTTLACNVASFIAAYRKYRVLLIDGDPQCNATQLLLPEADMQALYRSHTRTSRRPHRRPAATLYDVLQPIAAGEPTINDNVAPCLAEDNRFGVDLVAGHPEVALLEDKLSQAWLSFGGGDLGGARISNWANQVRQALDSQYDFAIYDVGPSLGALNRTVLIGADYFVTPMGCDIFSLMGIQNIAGWLSKWLEAYESAFAKCKQTWDVGEFDVRSDTGAMSRFIGYSVQQYITKAKEGKRRATKAFESIMKSIPPTVEEQLGSLVAPGVPHDKLRLPDVPHMYSLVPLAQNANAPIHGVESADGLVGAQYSQKEAYVSFIEDLSNAILANLGVELD
jgi:cellulose biosynthesis protein BcsQ